MSDEKTKADHRGPTFRTIMVRAPLTPGARRAALRAHQTKDGIERAALALLERQFIEPFEDEADRADAAEAAAKKKAAEDRKAAVRARQAARLEGARQKKLAKLEEMDPDLLRAALARLEKNDG